MTVGLDAVLPVPAEPLATRVSGVWIRTDDFGDTAAGRCRRKPTIEPDPEIERGGERSLVAADDNRIQRVVVGSQGMRYEGILPERPEELIQLVAFPGIAADDQHPVTGLQRPLAQPAGQQGGGGCRTLAEDVEVDAR